MGRLEDNPEDVKVINSLGGEKRLWMAENGGSPNGEAGGRGEDKFPSRAVEAVWG